MKNTAFWLMTAITLLGWIVVLSVSAVDATPKRPNILWLTIEDTSFLFGCYGDKVAKTPNIDRLAEEGTRFTHAFASSPVCSAARSALITGMDVGELGVGHHRSVVDIPGDVKGYPEYLRQSGYYCTNHTKNDFNFSSAKQFAKRCWDDNSKHAHWRRRGGNQPFFSVSNFNDSHQSRTSVNSFQKFKANIQSQLSPDEIASPDEVVLPPFYQDSPRMRKARAVTPRLARSWSLGFANPIRSLSVKRCEKSPYLKRLRKRSSTMSTRSRRRTEISKIRKKRLRFKPPLTRLSSVCRGRFHLPRTIIERVQRVNRCSAKHAQVGWDVDSVALTVIALSGNLFRYRLNTKVPIGTQIDE